MSNPPIAFWQMPDRPDAVTLLEAQLFETVTAVRDSFVEVTKFDQSEGRMRDDFGTKRSAAVKDAVVLMDASAKLGQAIAKIKSQSQPNQSLPNQSQANQSSQYNRGERSPSQRVPHVPRDTPGVIEVDEDTWLPIQKK